MEGNQIPPPYTHTADDDILDLSDDGEEVFHYKTEEHDTTNLKKKGRPPLGPKVAKLKHDLDEALNTIKEQEEKIQQLNLDLLLTTDHLKMLQEAGPNENQEDQTPQILELKETIRDNKEAIMTKTSTNLKQGKKITELLTLNQKLKNANNNLIERLATTELNATITNDNQNPTTPRYIIIGDSNAKRMEPALSKDVRFNITLHQSSTLKKTLHDLTNNNFPKHWDEAQAVVLFLGTNDVQNGIRARETQQTATQLTQAITQKGKRAVLCEIPPFRDNVHQEMEATIHNRLISNIPASSPYITLISYRDLISELPDNETFTDNVHIDPQSPASATIVHQIAQHLTSLDLTPLPPPESTYLATQGRKAPTVNPTPLKTSSAQPSQTYSDPSDSQQGRSKPFTRAFTVPKDTAGLAIGVRQTGINKLKEKFQIGISYISARNVDPLFKLTGDRKNVLQAEEEINRITANHPDPNQHQNTQHPSTYPSAQNLPNYPSTQNLPNYPSTQNTNECNCSTCKPNPTQCRNLQPLPSTPTAWPTPPQRDWSDSPMCKKAKQNY